jgi:hypothetical protein
MYKTLIDKMDCLQRTRLSCAALEKGRLQYFGGPVRKQDGMYWIYTEHSNDDLIQSRPCSKKGSIDFSALTLRNSNIKELCQYEVDGFRLVYSGIGGLGRKGQGGLRERILEEFRGGSGTGSLAIKGSSLSELSRWRVSYVLWSELMFPKEYEYSPFSTAIEGLWRLEFGWPLLCSK